MKSSENVRYNVYVPKAERNHVTHLNRATRTVYPLGSQLKLPRGTSSREQMRLLGQVITKQCCEIQSVGVFDLKQQLHRIVSVRHQSTARAIRKHRFNLLSYRSRGTLMSYTDILCSAALSRTRLMWEHKPNMRNTVQRDSQKAFQYAHRHYLPWIYCSDTHCTMVLWQKCGIFTLNFITGVMVYNYCKYVWLRQL